VTWLASAHLAATAALLGVAAFLHFVHYPLLRRVGSEGFPAYAAQHQRRSGWIVLPLMTGEAAAALLLVAAPPPAVPSWAPWAGLAAIAVAWLVTWGWILPAHLLLLEGFDADVHSGLLRASRARLVAGTLRTALATLIAAAA
jgi:hypothetical protein